MMRRALTDWLRRDRRHDPPQPSTWECGACPTRVQDDDPLVVLHGARDHLERTGHYYMATTHDGTDQGA